MSKADDLITILYDLGVDVNKAQGDEINARCPVHLKYKGRESSRNSWYLNIESGLWHCFTCGARGNLPMLVSELSDDPGTLWKVQSHLITQGLRRLTQEEAVYEEDIREDINWLSYGQLAEVDDRVLKFRKISREQATKFGLREDDQYRTTFPLVSPLGELKGWQAKKGKEVKNFPTGVHKSTTLFGIERAFGTTALLVEGPFDVPRFHSVYAGSDINCVSSFGASVSDEQIRLLSSKFTKLVVAMDNDDAGRRETRRLSKVLPSFKDGVYYWQYLEGDPKDIGEMTDGQIIKGVSRISRILR